MKGHVKSPFKTANFLNDWETLLSATNTQDRSFGSSFILRALRHRIAYSLNLAAQKLQVKEYINLL